MYTYKKGHVPSQMKVDVLRRWNTEHEDYCIIDDVLFRNNIPRDKNIGSSLLLVIPDTYVPTLLYQLHDSLLAGHQGDATMYLILKEKFCVNNLFNFSRRYAQSFNPCHTISAENQIIHPITQGFYMTLDLYLEYQQI